MTLTNASNLSCSSMQSTLQHDW